MKPIPGVPTQKDFDPWGCDLDAQCAWQNFGGLTVDEAKTKFAESPDIYQEDFMFMGGRAFAFYYGVIDDYLRSVPENDDDDDYEAWILSQCIRNQFAGDNLTLVRSLAPQVIGLANDVLKNMHKFGGSDEERVRIQDAWRELIDHIKGLTSASLL